MMRATLFVLLFATGVVGAAQAATLVKDVRVADGGETTRVVFDLSRAGTERIFTLENPDRVVIDMADARLESPVIQWPKSLGVIKRFDAADRGNGVLRVVIHVDQRVEPRSFALAPAEGLGHRLVIDLAALGKPTVVSTTETLVPVTPDPINDSGRTLVIAIDAGHGGTDPGAIGRKGTREKDVTLAIARKLKERIDNEPGMRAVLTRDTDTFVPLRERIVRARKQQADLFVSIHADSVRDRSITGSSVYVLSSGRATNEAARMLADRENAADLMGGVSLEDKSDVLASVLLDISQGASMSASIEAADKVLVQLNRTGDVIDDQVRHASLKVLTSPDMPSMLVETAFISNPKEEAKLNDARHQDRLANAVMLGVRNYFYDNPPPGTRVAQLAAKQRGNSPDQAAMSIMAGGR